MAYTELYFTPVMWPDFSEQDFILALEFFTQTERRFGKTTLQIRQEEASLLC
jgi:undecaprenyl diphosphate synthase